MPKPKTTLPPIVIYEDVPQREFIKRLRAAVNADVPPSMLKRWIKATLALTPKSVIE